MSLGNRVKELMAKKGVSAYMLSNETGISQATLSRILNKDTKPNASNLKLLSEYFHTTSTWLLTGNDESDITTNKNYAIQQIAHTLHEESDNGIINKNGNVFKQLSGDTFSVEVKVVPFEAYAKYVSEYSYPDAELFGDWEKVTFIVDRIGRGNYLGFKIKGDSMNGGNIMDTPDKAIVLGRELGRQHWKDGFKPTDHGWILITKDNMLFKDIVGLNFENGSIICHSRNPSPEYSDFEYPLNDIKQIFKVIKRTF